jgi:hypothetical protein
VRSVLELRHFCSTFFTRNGKLTVFILSYTFTEKRIIHKVGWQTSKTRLGKTNKFYQMLFQIVKFNQFFTLLTFDKSEGADVIVMVLGLNSSINSTALETFLGTHGIVVILGLDSSKRTAALDTFLRTLVGIMHRHKSLTRHSRFLRATKTNYHQPIQRICDGKRDLCFGQISAPIRMRTFPTLFPTFTAIQVSLRALNRIKNRECGARANQIFLVSFYSLQITSIINGCVFTAKIRTGDGLKLVHRIRYQKKIWKILTIRTQELRNALV